VQPLLTYDSKIGNICTKTCTKPILPRFWCRKSKNRKPGTGCISKVSRNTWQGKYTPHSKDGKREQHIVYAKSEEECERKLGEMIKELKNKEVKQ